MSVEILPPPIVPDDDICVPDSPHAPVVEKLEDDLRVLHDDIAQEDVPRRSDDEMLEEFREDILPMLKVSPLPTKDESMILALAPGHEAAVCLCHSRSM